MKGFFNLCEDLYVQFLFAYTVANVCGALNCIRIRHFCKGIRPSEKRCGVIARCFRRPAGYFFLPCDWVLEGWITTVTRLPLLPPEALLPCTV